MTLTVTQTSLQIASILGSLGIVSSVLWAIYTYRRTEERRAFAKTRENLTHLKNIIQEIDGKLSEPEFSLVGGAISRKLKALKPAEWTLQDFSNFMLDEKNHNLIGQAIHEGRLECNFITTVDKTIMEMDQKIVNLRERLPIISEVLHSLSLYIKRPAQTVISPSTFDKALGEPKVIADLLIPQVENIAHESIYFQTIANHCSAFCVVFMTSDILGQKTFDLAERIYKIVIDTYSVKTDAQLRKSSKSQHHSFFKLQSIDMEHSVEDAVQYLNLIKEDFSESDWDLIIDLKARIVQLMNSRDQK